jgi:hypothetical protein
VRFPKTCRCCAANYTLEQFQALPAPAGGGSKVTHDWEAREMLIDLFRVCQCGSTLMETHTLSTKLENWL